MTAICSPLHIEMRSEEAELKKKKKGQARGNFESSVLRGKVNRSYVLFLKVSLHV